MKRFIYVLFMLLVLASTSYAQNRGPLTNIWASWVNVNTNQNTVLTFPFNSRDLIITNGDANDSICVDLRGNTIQNNSCYAATNTVVQVGPSDTLYLSDFVTAAVTLQSSGNAASPISVMIAY